MNLNSYNKIAHQWAAARSKSFVSRLVVDFADKVSPKGKILDIGCGPGFPLTKYLCDRGFTVTGIDFSGQMIEIARSLSIESAAFIECDFHDFESPQKFDGVLAWDSLFHFPKESQESIYPKMGRLLKTGGYLLFTHGHKNGEHVDTMMGESFYYSSLAKTKVEELLTVNGFQLEYVYDDYIERDSHRALVVLARKE